jgi:hypothetical protein
MQNGSMTIYQAQMLGVDPGAAMPTLLAMDETGRGWVGPVTLRDKLIAQTAELDINFKMRPTELAGEEFSAFKRKVRCFTETLFKTCPTILNLFGDFTRKRFVVAIGHPTTWSPEDIGLYKSIFAEAECFARPGEFFGRDDGIEVELMVAPESHAALMNLINAKSSDSRGDEGAPALTVDDIPPGEYVVVFDFGSSTTDVTIIRNNGGHIETGQGIQGDAHLGARYIDRAIYWTIRDEKLSGKARDNLLSALKLPGNKNLERQLIYHCRGAKETFFLTEPQDRENNMFPPLPKTPGRFFQLDDEFTADGCGIMEKAVNESIPELGGKSWKETCREVFTHVKTLLDTQESAPILVFLTGGASRMDFVQAFAREIFQGVRILTDSHPAHCISHGLAYLPHKLEQAKALLDEVDQYVKVKLPQAVVNAIPEIAKVIAPEMANRICSIAQSEAFRWKEGHWDTLSDMERGIKESATAFLKSEEAKRQNANSIGQVLEWTLGKSLDDLLKICGSYGIDVDKRSFKINNPIMDWLKELRHIATGNSWGNSSAEIGRAIGGSLTSIAVVVMVVLSPMLLPLVESLVAVLVGVLSWLVFEVLGFSGPVGWAIIAAVVGISLVKLIASGWKGMKSSFLQKVKTWNLPLWCRKLISSEKIEATIDEQRSNITESIQDKLSTDEQFKTVLVDALVKPIAARFMMMAEDLALRIKK